VDNPQATPHRRDIVYHGNIDPGERVAVVLRAVRRGAGMGDAFCGSSISVSPIKIA